MATEWDRLSDAELLHSLGPRRTPSDRSMAFSALLARYQRSILECAAAVLRGQWGTTIEPCDVAQETFAKLLRLEVATQYDSTRPFGPWLMQVARNVARGLLRRQRKEQARLSPADLDALQCVSDSTQEMLCDQDDVTTLLERLDPLAQRVVKSFYLDNRSAREIAAEVDKPESWVYRTLHFFRTTARQTVIAKESRSGHRMGTYPS